MGGAIYTFGSLERSWAAVMFQVCLVEWGIFYLLEEHRIVWSEDRGLLSNLF